MLLTTEVEMNPRKYVKYYEDKGYIFPRHKKHGRYSVPSDVLIKIKVDDLPPGSNVEVKVLCDYCNINIKRPEYYKYLKQRELVQKDCCTDCVPLKVKETSLIKYGVDSYNKLPESKERQSKQSAGTDEEIISIFEDVGYIVTKIERMVDSLPSVLVSYICKKHKEKGTRSIQLCNFKKGHRCWFCGRENAAQKQTGENSHWWKGGITSIHQYLRNNLSDWYKDTMISCAYKCVLTGHNFDTIHHLYSFNEIVFKTIEVLSLPIYKEVNMYSHEDLISLEKTCLQLHYKYGLGVCLSVPLHNLFHIEYGKGNNTSEQFDKFVERYKFGEFDSELDEQYKRINIKQKTS